MTPSPHPAVEIVDQIDPLHAAATEGPWLANLRGGGTKNYVHNDRGMGVFYAHCHQADAALIVALRNRWPEIAALLRRLETAERDADRLRVHCRHTPTCAGSNDHSRCDCGAEEAARCHDEAVALRGPS